LTEAMTGLADISLFFGYLALGLLLLAIIQDVQRDLLRLVSGRNVVLLSIVLWYGLEAATISTTRVPMTQDDYDFGILCVLLSATCFLFGYASRNATLFHHFARQVTLLDDPRWLWRFFLIGFFLGAAPILILGGFDLTHFLENVFESRRRWDSILNRGRYGGARDLLIELKTFHTAIIPIAIILMLDKSHNTARRVAAGIFLAWLSLRALNSGTRSTVFTVGLPIAGGFYFLMSRPRRRQAILYLLPAAIVLGYIWSAAVVVTRDRAGFDLEEASRAEYVGFEMFRELIYITSHLGQNLDYEWGRTYLTQVVNPIPRYLWPGKPVSDAGLLLAISRGEVSPETGEAYLTRSPGLIGEMYWNFGIFGVIGLSLLGGYLTRAWDRILEVQPRSFVLFLIYCSGLAILFLSGRSFSMSALYGLLALYLMMYLFGLTTRRTREAAPAVGPDARAKLPRRL
jgi:oligosaccharide repeat unit polymerase